MDATALLRPGLLDDVVVAFGGAAALAAPLAALGAAIPALAPTLDEERAAEQVREVAAAHGRLDALVHDLRPAFAADADGGLRAALDLAWVPVRAVAVTAFIPGERGGSVVLVAPPPSREPSAAGLRAATENLARTLSIEWARHGIRTVAIAPGPASADAELAALAAYLVSPAGDYFSGCCLALGEIAPA
jgi:NAD(P)-dependent dehydrogenase (short-subunit alcohol dehydrogenase family)